MQHSRLLLSSDPPKVSDYPPCRPSQQSAGGHCSLKEVTAVCRTSPLIVCVQQFLSVRGWQLLPPSLLSAGRGGFLVIPVCYLMTRDCSLSILLNNLSFLRFPTNCCEQSASVEDWEDERDEELLHQRGERGERPVLLLRPAGGGTQGEGGVRQ